MLFPTDNLIWVMPTEGLSVYGVTRMRFFILKGTNIMNITPRQMLLYAVSDRAWSRDEDEFIAQVRQAVISGVTIFQLREKGFLFNNAYINASKQKRETMDKKPYYKQSGIVFLMIGIIFLIDAAEMIFEIGWLFYLVIVIAVIAIVYAIISSVVIEKSKK